jgi:CubicO group peptidase (beta-lactamase class C family)
VVQKNPNSFPPRSEWDRPPWNRWSFQHIREILPTTEVWRGDGPAHVFPQGKTLPLDLAVTGLNGTATHLGTLLDETYTDGFMVLKNGAVVIEQYFNGLEQRTLHLSQSVAKSLTGAIAGIFVGRGLLNVDAPITDYLPELVATAWRGATLQQVLDMKTGVRFNEDYTDPYSDIGKVDVACGWKPAPPESDPSFKWPAHMWDLILQLTECTRAHGVKFEYRSIETDVLAFCMERVTGKPLAQIFSEELWQKMGASQNANFTVDAAGFATADGGFNACLRDYARFGQLILEQGGGIIPAPWLATTRVGLHGCFEGRYAQTLAGGAYRNMFWIEGQPSRALLARGVFGQLIYINSETGVVAVKLSSWPEFVMPGFEIETINAIHSIETFLNSVTTGI